MKYKTFLEPLNEISKDEREHPLTMVCMNAFPAGLAVSYIPDVVNWLEFKDEGFWYNLIYYVPIFVLLFIIFAFIAILIYLICKHLKP